MDAVDAVYEVGRAYCKRKGYLETPSRGQVEIVFESMRLLVNELHKWEEKDDRPKTI